MLISRITTVCKGTASLEDRDQNSKEYQSWSKKEKSEVRSAALGEIREKYDVSQTGAERIVKEMGKHFKQKRRKDSKHKQKVHLDSHVVQKIALHVWKSISDYLFRKGKRVHF
ncbi:hypothetical protein FB550_11529 [Neobacillus bataviensis]|uniref:Transposase n=1 Tax=Neobacillus bataviensis TaxID=220685 RepID=A0A561CQX3_9BACI|nr:hypothetical protein [Neobacillus bataviensis]TWD93392.1 hypothetical protein FB550_11529 [Neobacillus bataviensis]